MNAIKSAIINVAAMTLGLAGALLVMVLLGAAVAAVILLLNALS